MNSMTRMIFSACGLLIFILLCLMPGLGGNLGTVAPLDRNTLVGRVTDAQGRSLAGLLSAHAIRQPAARLTPLPRPRAAFAYLTLKPETTT